MIDQSIIRLYVEEIAAQAADIARLKARLASSEQETKDALALAAGYRIHLEQVKAERDDALTMANGYRAEVEQVKAELIARLAVAEEEAK